jgi:hypothetical protein
MTDSSENHVSLPMYAPAGYLYLSIQGVRLYSPVKYHPYPVGVSTA